MNDAVDFLNINYLRHGSFKQRQAAMVLDELKLFTHLKPYDPILAGTIPIEIDIPGSDLDIICQVTDFVRFERCIQEHYGAILPELSYSTRTVNELKRMVVRFVFKGWDFEIFAQPVSSVEQNGYRHMVIESRLLKHLGEAGKQKIIDLKKSGYKTEPAFAELLKIAGDPYEELLQMYHWSEEQLEFYIQSYHKKGKMMNE